MLNMIKKMFYNWAFIDINHTCAKKETYFWRFPQEIGRKNLQMVKSVAIMCAILCVFIIVSTLTYYFEEELRNIYIGILIFEVSCVIISYLLLKVNVSYKVSNLLALLYFIHMLLLSGYLGVIYSLNETGAVFVVILVVSMIVFVFPPILTSIVATIATTIMLVASYVYKDLFWFQSDVINCLSTLILSMLLSWRINRIRVQEAFSRERVLVLNEELQRISNIDLLTGLLNHRKFQDVYYSMFANAVNLGERLGIIMMDLDNFKSYNDNYGHIEGDKCLNAVATTFLKFCNESISVYRYGGEEFVFLVAEEKCGEIVAIAEGVRKSVEALEIKHEFSVAGKVVTISLGCVVSLPSQNDKPASILEIADAAMYRSKREGRNRVSV